jgi:hypothetical protein
VAVVDDQHFIAFDVPRARRDQLSSTPISIAAHDPARQFRCQSSHTQTAEVALQLLLSEHASRARSRVTRK